jgi:hypothetical protein
MRHHGTAPDMVNAATTTLVSATAVLILMTQSKMYRGRATATYVCVAGIEHSIESTNPGGCGSERKRGWSKWRGLVRGGRAPCGGSQKRGVTGLHVSERLREHQGDPARTKGASRGGDSTHFGLPADAGGWPASAHGVVRHITLWCSGTFAIR